MHVEWQDDGLATRRKDARCFRKEACVVFPHEHFVGAMQRGAPYGGIWECRLCRVFLPVVGKMAVGRTDPVDIDGISGEPFALAQALHPG